MLLHSASSTQRTPCVGREFSAPAAATIPVGASAASVESCRGNASVAAAAASVAAAAAEWLEVGPRDRARLWWDIVATQAALVAAASTARSLPRGACTPGNREVDVVVPVCHPLRFAPLASVFLGGGGGDMGSHLYGHRLVPGWFTCSHAVSADPAQLRARNTLVSRIVSLATMSGLAVPALRVPPGTPCPEKLIAAVTHGGRPCIEPVAPIRDPHATPAATTEALPLPPVMRESGLRALAISAPSRWADGVDDAALDAALTCFGPTLVTCQLALPRVSAEGVGTALRHCVALETLEVTALSDAVAVVPPPPPSLPEVNPSAATSAASAAAGARLPPHRHRFLDPSVAVSDSDSDDDKKKGRGGDGDSDDGNDGNDDDAPLDRSVTLAWTPAAVRASRLFPVSSRSSSVGSNVDSAAGSTHVTATTTASPRERNYWARLLVTATGLPMEHNSVSASVRASASPGGIPPPHHQPHQPLCDGLRLASLRRLVLRSCFSDIRSAATGVDLGCFDDALLRWIATYLNRTLQELSLLGPAGSVAAASSRHGGFATPGGLGHSGGGGAAGGSDSAPTVKAWRQLLAEMHSLRALDVAACHGGNLGLAMEPPFNPAACVSGGWSGVLASTDSFMSAPTVSSPRRRLVRRQMSSRQYPQSPVVGTAAAAGFTFSDSLVRPPPPPPRPLMRAPLSGSNPSSNATSPVGGSRPPLVAPKTDTALIRSLIALGVSASKSRSESSSSSSSSSASSSASSSPSPRTPASPTDRHAVPLTPSLPIVSTRSADDDDLTAAPETLGGCGSAVVTAPAASRQPQHGAFVPVPSASSSSSSGSSSSGLAVSDQARARSAVAVVFPSQPPHVTVEGAGADDDDDDGVAHTSASWPSSSAAYPAASSSTPRTSSASPTSLLPAVQSVAHLPAYMTSLCIPYAGCSDAALASICRQLPLLTHLDLTGNTAVSGVALVTHLPLLKRCRSLCLGRGVVSAPAGAQQLQQQQQYPGTTLASARVGLLNDQCVARLLHSMTALESLDLRGTPGRPASSAHALPSFFSTGSAFDAPASTQVAAGGGATTPTQAPRGPRGLTFTRAAYTLDAVEQGDAWGSGAAAAVAYSSSSATGGLVVAAPVRTPFAPAPFLSLDPPSAPGDAPPALHCPGTLSDGGRVFARSPSSPAAHGADVGSRVHALSLHSAASASPGRAGPGSDTTAGAACTTMMGALVIAPRLTRLDVSYCHGLTAGSLETLCAVCPRLRSLRLAHCGRLRLSDCARAFYYAPAPFHMPRVGCSDDAAASYVKSNDHHNSSGYEVTAPPVARLRHLRELVDAARPDDPIEFFANYTRVAVVRP